MLETDYKLFFWNCFGILSFQNHSKKDLDKYVRTTYFIHAFGVYLIPMST